MWSEPAEQDRHLGSPRRMSIHMGCPHLPLIGTLDQTGGEGGGGERGRGEEGGGREEEGGGKGEEGRRGEIGLKERESTYMYVKVW